MKNILVTGINGYIGTILGPKLQKKGYKVFGWDTDYFKKATLGKQINTYHSKKMDIRQNNYDLENIDCIIHLAALSNDPMGALNERLTYEINYKSTLNLAKMAKKKGVRRFIFSSSCAVYGIAKENIVSEKSPINPLTAYARSKALVEKALQDLADEKFCVCLLRNATVFGFSPRFRNDLVVNNLVTSGLAFGEIRVLSDGSPWRPLIDVRDLADIFSNFIQIDSLLVNKEIVNIGFTDSNYQVKDILKLIKKYLPDCDIKFMGKVGKDSRSYRVDFSKLQKLFPNIRQNWPLEKSIKDLIKQLRKNKFSRKDFEKESFVRLAILESLLQQNKIDKKLYWKS